MSENPSIAREIATRVLHGIAKRDAWAAPLLDAEIRRRGADPRDAALATEIVYGVLRTLPEIDEAVEGRLRRGSRRLDPWARAAMRAAAYQILHLARVPPHAAVHDAVALVRRERGPKLGGFVNAVLRKVPRPSEPKPPEAIAAPRWLRASLGPHAEPLLRARPLPPPIGLRVIPAKSTRAHVAEAIRHARPRAEVHDGALAPQAVLVRHAGDPRQLPGHAQGWFAVQEEGAQVVGLLAGAREGERVADACAGRGGKTTQLAEAVGTTGQVTAIDLHEPKLERIPAELERLGLPQHDVALQAVDLSVGTAGLEAAFDRVLVDAPCTNLGTLQRRPELLLRVREDDPARMAELQLSILLGAARLVRPGGLLVYAVCSPTGPEGAGVAQRFEQSRRDVRRADEPWPLGLAPDDDGIVRLGPWLGPPEIAPDAYQVARWRVG